jgi:hypothetical protein
MLRNKCGRRCYVVPQGLFLLLQTVGLARGGRQNVVWWQINHAQWYITCFLNIFYDHLFVSMLA